MVRERLLAAGGDRVKIVAITKGFGPQAISAALSLGLEDVGENFAQELLAKAEHFQPQNFNVKPRWHFVGQLQRNKVRKLAGVVDIWQSVDRTELATEIARRAAGAKVLVQVDIAGDVGTSGAKRGGCAPHKTASLVEHCQTLGLEVLGLMGIGDPTSLADARGGFRRLAFLANKLGLDELSMGMSGDLEVAVSEGASMVRVGTALFGSRPVLSKPVM